MFVVTLLLSELVVVDAGAVGHVVAARAALHGRGLRLLPAGREPAGEDAHADAAQAGARLRTRRRAGDAESGRPRLQGPLERRHLVPRPALDRTRQGARDRGTRRRRRPARASTAPRSTRRSPPCPLAPSCCATSTKTSRSCSSRAGRSRTSRGRSRATRSADSSPRQRAKRARSEAQPSEVTKTLPHRR